MNVPQDHVHTWELSRQSRLLRFYLWAYGGDESRVNFCKLFWGVVVAPLAVTVIGTLNGAIWLFEFMRDRLARPQASAERQAVRAAAKVVKKAAGPSRGERFLDAIARAADCVAAFFQRHPHIMPVFLWSVFIAAGLALFSGAGYGVDLMVIHFSGTLNVLKWAGIVVGIAIGAAVVGVPLGMVLDRFGAFRAFADGVCGVGAAIATGAKGAGRFLSAGHHAVKYRTCPRVEIRA